MATELLKGPKCGSEHAYDDGSAYVCPERAHESSIAIDGVFAMKLESELVKKL